MIVTKNTPISAIEYTETIFIDKGVSLDTHFLEQIMQTFPLSKIVIQTYDPDLHSSIDSSVLYTNEELQVLTKNTELAKTKYQKDLTFDDGFTIEQAISASRKINDYADFINNAKINGEPLSPLEKYTLAYSLISDRLYAKSKSTQGSRNIISVLTGDEIVCAGFASALAQLCNKIGIPCTYRGCVVEDGQDIENHANCIVRIEDDKYNVHGLYNADPTWDCIQVEYKELLELGYNFNFKHFLLTSDEHSKIYPNIRFDNFLYYGENGKLYYRKIKIPNIDALYPETKITEYKNPTIFSTNSHDIDIEEIKRQAITRLIESFPITENPNKKHIQGLISESLLEPITNYMLEETLNTPPEEKTEVIEFVARYYSYLNSNYTVDEIKEMLVQRIVNLPAEKITNAYMVMVNSNSKKYHYSQYVNQLIFDKHNSKPITKKTLKALFKNMLPLMVNYNGEFEDEIIEEMVNDFTPLALKAPKQKSQE